MIKFVVMTTQRSRSVFLETILSSHPQIHCHAEIFSAQPDIFSRSHWVHNFCFYNFWLQKTQEDPWNITYIAKPKVMDDYFDFFYNPQKLPEAVLEEKPADTIQAIGVDIKYTYYPVEPLIWESLKKHNVRFIHLIRRNTLKTYISCLLNHMKELLGRKSHGVKKILPHKVRLDDQKHLLSELTRREQEVFEYRELLTKNGHPYIEIHYEDFFDSPEQESHTIRTEVLNKVYDFLNIYDRRNDLQTPYRKTNPSCVKDLIENYDEVCDWLAGSRFECLLEKDEQPVSV